jgi:hypothetical protein
MQYGRTICFKKSLAIREKMIQGQKKKKTIVLIHNILLGKLNSFPHFF